MPPAISDAHVHFFSKHFYSGLAKQCALDKPEALGPKLRWEIPADPETLADRWVQELDANGVSKACLIASVHGDEDSVAAAVSRHPKRFFGYFMVDPLQPNAAERMQAAASNRALHGVCLFPAMHRYSIQDERVLPVLEAAAANRMVIFVHCGALSVGVRAKLGLPSRFDLRFSNPIDLHAVALQFPQTPFVIPHFGAGMFREALMVADLCSNIYFDTSSTNRWMNYEGLNLATVFRRCLNVLGSRRLLFGSDSSFFPRGWVSDVLKQQMIALQEIGLSSEDINVIFGGNLERLLTARLAYS